MATTKKSTKGASKKSTKGTPKARIAGKIGASGKFKKNATKK